MTAVIGYVHGGTVRAEFMASVTGVLRDGSAPVQAVIGVSSGPNISKARNLLAAAFLEDHAAPWLWMLDTDMIFGPDALDRLTAAADPVLAPVAGALYMTAGNGEPGPAMYELGETGGRTRFRILRAWPEDTLLQVGATGTGCLLVHRTALAAIAAAAKDEAAPWFRETDNGAGLIGEDLTFCLRAAGAGIPVHVHTGIQAGHVKPSVLWPGQAIQQLGR